MNSSLSARGEALSRDQVAHLIHELLTPVNHILGLTEIQIDEAPETGLRDYVPAFTQINACGRTLVSIIEEELASCSRPLDLKHLDERIESEAEPTLGAARKLAERLRTTGSHEAASEMDLVSSALESLLAIARGMTRDKPATKSN
jgi:signal transduction histidine kinase